MIKKITEEHNYENSDFYSDIKVGDIVIVYYRDCKLDHDRYYVSTVKNIREIDKYDHILRLDNFNIDFKVCFKSSDSVTILCESARYMEDNCVAEVYTLKEFKRLTYYMRENTFINPIDFKSYLDNLDKMYKALVEALELQITRTGGQ